MKILAFLQNMYCDNPELVKRIVTEDNWNRLVKKFLFQSFTGKRIIKAFGEELANRIIYDESTDEIADNPYSACKPNIVHIRWALHKHKPDIVITFGGIAYKSVSSVYKGELIRLPHPASRRADTMPRLVTAKLKIERIK